MMLGSITGRIRACAYECSGLGGPVKKWGWPPRVTPDLTPDQALRANFYQES